jgi:hypothetical protein
MADYSPGERKNNGIDIIAAAGARYWYSTICERGTDRWQLVARAEWGCIGIMTMADPDGAIERRDPSRHWVRAFHHLFNPHPSHAALVELDGTVLAVNTAWDRFAQASGVAAGYTFVGQNYLAAAEAGVSAGEPGSRETYVGLLDVLRNGRPKFTLTYACHSPSRQAWYRIWIEPQAPTVPAVIVAHQLVSSRPWPTGDLTSTDAVATSGNYGGVLDAGEPSAEDGPFGMIADPRVGRSGDAWRDAIPVVAVG